MEPTGGRQGGMWLGFNTKNHNGTNKKHCVGILLNIPGDFPKNYTARGNIVKDYLLTPKEFPEYINRIESKNVYSGYSLVGVELSKDGTTTYHHSNSPSIDTAQPGKQILAFGNSPVFSPLQKVRNGLKMFENILKKESKREDLIQDLLMLLKDKTRHLPDMELQTRAPETFESLSSIYVDMGSKGYGTRTHTIILVDYEWNLEFTEYTMKEPIDPLNPEWIENRIQSVL